MTIHIRLRMKDGTRFHGDLIAGTTMLQVLQIMQGSRVLAFVEDELGEIIVATDSISVVEFPDQAPTPLEDAS